MADPKPKPKPKPTVNPEYRAFSRAVRKPGMQAGERAVLRRIADRRGVSIERAAAIAVRRTAEGRNVGGDLRRGLVTGTAPDGTARTRTVTMRKKGAAPGRWVSAEKRRETTGRAPGTRARPKAHDVIETGRRRHRAGPGTGPHGAS